MDEDLQIYRRYGKKIENFLRLSSFPIAIKLIKEEKEAPDNCKTPSSALNTKNFLCQNFKIVRSYGWTMMVTEEDCVCKVARVVYGWDPFTKELTNWANNFNVGLYAKDIETSNKLFKHLYFLKNEYKGLVISPLTRTKIKPEVVQIYCLPAQAMRLIQSYLFMAGGVLEFASAGRVGSCHGGIIKPILTDKPQLVILGNGDRVWGGADDSEVMFSTPTSKLEILVEGLEATHKAGLRFPIPKYMNYEPGFQPSFKAKATKRAGGTLFKDSN